VLSSPFTFLQPKGLPLFLGVLKGVAVTGDSSTAEDETVKDVAVETDEVFATTSDVNFKDEEIAMTFGEVGRG